MNINNTQIASTASQPLNSNAHSEASISQLISPGILPSSQPLLTSDQSRVEIVTRHRETRRTRRRRRAPSEHQHLAQQIQRRHMANQYRQQQQYDRSDWYEERERHEREDHDRAGYMRRQPSNFSEHYEEVIEERLQEVYDWEMMHINDHSEQGESNNLEGIAALEQLSLVHDQMDPSHQLQNIASIGRRETTNTGTSIRKFSSHAGLSNWKCLNTTITWFNVTSHGANSTERWYAPIIRKRLYQTNIKINRNRKRKNDIKWTDWHTKPKLQIIPDFWKQASSFLYWINLSSDRTYSPFPHQRKNRIFSIHFRYLSRFEKRHTQYPRFSNLTWWWTLKQGSKRSS